MSRRPVVIESPYAGNVVENMRYLDACILDCIRRGETPYASHKMLTGALDDSKPEEREEGIGAGFDMVTILARAGAVRAVYTDRGLPPGVSRGLGHAAKIRQKIEYRTVPGWRDR